MCPCSRKGREEKAKIGISEGEEDKKGRRVRERGNLLCLSGRRKRGSEDKREQKNEEEDKGREERVKI